MARTQPPSRSTAMMPTTLGLRSVKAFTCEPPAVRRRCTGLQVAAPRLDAARGSTRPADDPVGGRGGRTERRGLAARQPGVVTPESGAGSGGLPERARAGRRIAGLVVGADRSGRPGRCRWSRRRTTAPTGRSGCTAPGPRRGVDRLLARFCWLFCTSAATACRLSMVLVMVLWLLPIRPARSVATCDRLPTTSSSSVFFDASADDTVWRLVTRRVDVARPRGQRGQHLVEVADDLARPGSRAPGRSTTRWRRC